MASRSKPVYDLNEAEKHFEQFIKDFNREYKDEEDKAVHYQAFVKSLDKINKLNSDNNTATYGINKFADYTEEEMQQMRGFKPKPK